MPLIVGQQDHFSLPWPLTFICPVIVSRSEYTYLSWLARCHVRCGKARLAWELYLRMETSDESYHLLQVRDWHNRPLHVARVGPTGWKLAPLLALQRGIWVYPMHVGLMSGTDTEHANEVAEHSSVRLFWAAVHIAWICVHACGKALREFASEVEHDEPQFDDCVVLAQCRPTLPVPVFGL